MGWLIAMTPTAGSFETDGACAQVGLASHNQGSPAIQIQPALRARMFFAISMEQ
jgi:hypothetical protein